MVKKRLLSFLFPILIATSIVIASASFIIPIYDTDDNARSENAVPTVSKSNAEAYIKETGGYYISVEDALKAANQRTSATNVYVIPGTNPIIETQCEVGNNVTLNFPYEGETIEPEESIKDPNSNDGKGNRPYSGFANSGSSYCKNSVKIVKIEKNNEIIPTISVSSGGTINIGGCRGMGPQGCTSYNFVELILDPGVRIDCYGKIYCMGYIRENEDYNSSYINVYREGIITQPLVVYDWGSAGQANGAMNKDVFPFNYFDFPNISPAINFYSGSRFEADAFLFGDTAGDMTGSAYVIGASNDDALLISNSTSNDDYIRWQNVDFSDNSNKLTNSKTKHLIDVDIFGSYSLKSLKLTVGTIITGVDIDSSKLAIPFSNFFNISINRGTFNVDEMVKFMPGSSITIKNDATVNLNNDVVIYQTNTFNGRKIYSYDVKNEAKLINEGILNIKQGFAGHIYPGDSGNNNTKIITNDFSNVSFNEVYSYSGSSIFTSANVTSFTFSSTTNLALAKDAASVEVSQIEPNQTYFYQNSNSLSYFYLDGFIVKFDILPPDEGLVNQDVSYTIEVTSSDGSVTNYNNPEYIRLFTGDSFKIISMNNAQNVYLNSTEITNYLDKTYFINDSSYNFEIKPNQVQESEIESVSIEYSTDGNSYKDANDHPKFEEDVTLYFRANIKTINGGQYSLNTTFSWKEGNTEISTQSSFTKSYTQTSNDDTYIISLFVRDGKNNKTFNDSFEFTIKKESSGITCLLPESTVLLFDGTTKLVKDLNKNDLLLTYNHYTGQFEGQKLILNAILEEQLFQVITLRFSNKNVLRVVSGHGLFNLSKGCYEIYHGEEFKDHIGENFASVSSFRDGFKFEPTTLIDVEITTEKVIKYAPVTEYNANCIADGMLTIPNDLEGLFDAFIFSDLNNGLIVDMNDFMKKVEIYGTYEYNDVKKVMPKYLYDVLIFKYFKTFVGVGTLSFEKINYWLQVYGRQMCEYQGIEWDWDNSEPLSKKHG